MRPHRASRSVLLVEGADDHKVVHNLVVQGGQAITFDIIGGKERLGAHGVLRELRALCLTGADIVGAIVDADSDVEGRWQQIEDVLLGVGHTGRREQSQSEGLIISEFFEPQRRRPRVGIWVMPDNSSEGTLEDFLTLLARGDALLDHARRSLINSPSSAFAPPTAAKQ